MSHKKSSEELETFRQEMQERSKDTLLESLGIELTQMEPGCVAGKMPVDRRTFQPMAMLHGGASVALAESLASIGANMNLDWNRQFAVGLEINANHIYSVHSGFVYGEARPLHIGRTTQVWEIEVKIESGKLVCSSRCTLANVDRATG